MRPIDDLLIIADPKADFFDIVQRVRGGAGIEVRLDRRRGERRRPAEAAAPSEDRPPDAPESEERRRRDRRTRDITEELRTVGWVFIPASERGG